MCWFKCHHFYFGNFCSKCLPFCFTFIFPNLIGLLFAKSLQKNSSFCMTFLLENSYKYVYKFCLHNLLVLSFVAHFINVFFLFHFPEWSSPSAIRPLVHVVNCAAINASKDTFPLILSRSSSHLIEAMVSRQCNQFQQVSFIITVNLNSWPDDVLCGGLLVVCWIHDMEDLHSNPIIAFGSLRI